MGEDEVSVSQMQNEVKRLKEQVEGVLCDLNRMQKFVEADEKVREALRKVEAKDEMVVMIRKKGEVEFVVTHNLKDNWVLKRELGVLLTAYRFL